MSYLRAVPSTTGGPARLGQHRGARSLNAGLGCLTEIDTARRCKEGAVDAYLNLGLRPHVERGNLEGATVWVRFDKEQATDYGMGHSTDGEAVFFPNPKGVILKMASHESMLLRFTPFNSPPQETSFTLTGLGTLLPELQEACAWNPDLDRRGRAATLHEGNLERDREALPPLLKDLRSKKPEKRANAAIQLGTMHPDLAPQVVPALVAAIADPDLDVRLRVVRALGDVGPFAASALPALQRAGTDSDPRIREAAKKAIARIQQ